MTQRDFVEISRLAREQFGLDLKEGKEELVAARLGKKAREGGFPSIRDYYRHVLDDRTGESLIGLIDALTTNHTSFYREPAHFEFMRQLAAGDWRSRRSLDIWSAACSTGEEPYTAAFVLLDELERAAPAGAPRPELRILATDISTRALAAAARGIYPAARFEGCPGEWLRKYTLRGSGQWEEHHRVKPGVRALIEFRRINLTRDEGFQGAWPLIFCRNVMIYFDKPTQAALVGRLADRLEPGGYLFVGHAESLTGVDHPLEYVRPAVYRKPGGRGGRR